MTTIHEFHELAERARGVLEPDAATIERIELRYQAQAAADVPSRAPRRTRRQRWALGTAAGLAALAIAMPFAVDRLAEEGAISTTQVPLTAPEAFAQAARAAASEQWHPLAEGEYHHVYSVDVPVPEDPWRGEDEPVMVPGLGASATESWVARDGRGRVVNIRGLYGNDPDEYMELSRNRQGRITGGGWSTPNPNADSLPIREQLRHADTLMVFAFGGPGSRASMTNWYRQPEGYVPSRSPGNQGYIPSRVKGSDADRFQTFAWGNTIEHFDRLNALEGDELETELLQLIASGPVPGQSEYELGGDTYGATRDVIATEERIARAVRLLGSAPLAPHVRSAIFGWLAEQDPERVDSDATDVLGRPGTRVTFKAEHERLVLGRTWTIEEIVEARKGDGQPVIGRLEAEPTYDVQQYSEYRKWYVDVIFDERTGRLLQEASYTRWGSDGAQPSLIWEHEHETGQPTVTKVEFRPETGVVGSGSAYIRVGRTTGFEAASTVCREHPEACR